LLNNQNEIPFKSRLEKLVENKKKEVLTKAGKKGEMKGLLDTFFENIEAKEEIKDKNDYDKAIS